MDVTDAIKANKGPRLSTMCRSAVKSKTCGPHARVNAVKNELEKDRTKPVMVIFGY
jgi:hypothetical protein